MRRRDCLMMMSGSVPALLAFRSGPETAALDALEAGLGPTFSGVVAHGVGDAPPIIRARGWSDAEAGIPAEADTAYALGSASKWFATVATLRAVDQERLELDAPISRYLPDFRRDVGDRTTVRLLLANRSGIADGISAAARETPALRRSDLTAAEAVTRYAQEEPAFPPDARFDYSLTNWVILRALLEARMGEDFVSLMRRLVFDPLRLRRTGVAERGFDHAPNVAAAYAADDPSHRKMEGVPAFAAASGVFYSSAPDLVRAARAVFGPSFLSESSRRALIEVRSPEEDYALGGRVRRIDGRAWAWETGRIAAYRCHLAHALDGPRRTLAVLNNTDLDQGAIERAVLAAIRT